MSARASSRPVASTVPARSNPRRRTRQEIDGTSSLRQPRAKRSRIDNGTFTPSRDLQSASRASQEIVTNGHAAPNGHPNGTLQDPSQDASVEPMDTDPSPPPDTLPHNYGSGKDGIDVLTKTDFYFAGRLPSFPTELEKSGSDFYSSIFLPASLAVAVSRKSAYIWEYKPSNHNSPVRVFSLPTPLADHEPLPVAAIVKNSPNSNIGLVLVNSRSGQVTFWEDIDNAAALSLFEQKRNGTEGSLGSMMSGEYVTSIAYAEPAGYVISMSSGRVAQLSLWDSQSRPAISARFLKSSKANTGYLGGIWNALGVGGFLKDVVAVRTQPSQVRATSDVVVASEQSVFQYWQISGSGQPNLKIEVHAREHVEAAVQEVLQNDMPSRISSVTLADCTVESLSPKSIHLICLVAVGGVDFSTYALLDILIHSDSSIPQCKDVVRLSSYAPPLLIKGSRSRPRIASSAGSPWIFLTLEQAVVIASKGSKRFQDCVYLRDDQEIRTSSLTAEPYEGHGRDSSAVLMMAGHGAVRISTPHEVPSEAHGRLSARTKIEQAIFYGTKPTNPFDLARGPEQRHPIEQVEEAAVAVSHDILCSKYSNIMPSLPTMSQDLVRRSRALEDLARHIRITHPGVSRVTKWTLLWDAEKLAAARTAWAQHETQKHGRGVPARLLSEIVECMHEDVKSFSEDDVDQLRSFYRLDLHRVSNLIAWSYQIIHFIVQHEGEGKTSDRLAELVCQAGQMIIGMLTTAFHFRQQNASQYGLGEENLQDGTLKSPEDYRGLPEFWTSTPMVLQKMKEYIKGVQEMAHLDAAEGRQISDKFVSQLQNDHPPVVTVWFKAVEERFAWSKSTGAQEDEKGKHRYWRHNGTEILSEFVMFDQLDAGLEIAETFQDMKALTALLKAKANALKTYYGDLNEPLTSQNPQDREARNRRSLEAQDAGSVVENRIRRYCAKFGPDFYETYFSEMVTGRRLNMLLGLCFDYRKEVTQFLRSDSSLNKLGWINEVLTEKDYSRASEALVWTAQHGASRPNKKTFLAHAKLALLAAAEDGAASVVDSQQIVAAEWELSEVQQNLYKHLSSVTKESLDRDAALVNLMEQFATSKAKVPKKGRKAARSLLQFHFTALIAEQTLDAEHLADTLTLMDVKECPTDEENDIDARSQYGWALRALQAGSCMMDTDEQRIETAKRIAWRRAYIEDDWSSIIDTMNKTDDEISMELQATVLYFTFVECIKKDILKPSSKPPTPDEVAHAGTSPEDLIPRFKDAAIAEDLSTEMQSETKVLKKLVSECDLPRWIETTFELALQSASEQTSAEDEQRIFLTDYADAQMDIEKHKVPAQTELNGQGAVENGTADGEHVNGEAMELDDGVMNGDS